MKVYTVKPNSYFIRVSDGRQLEFVERTAPLAIVTDVIGDETKAKSYLRYDWRWDIFRGWAKLQHDMGVTEEQVKEVIADIEGAEADAKKIAARAAREFPEIINDTGVHKKEI